MNRDVFLPKAAVLSIRESAADGHIKKKDYLAVSNHPKTQPVNPNENKTSENPRGQYGGGAQIDVSPNGSWLAWFKLLPAPSPPSHPRLNLTPVSASSTRNNETPTERSNRSDSMSSDATTALASANRTNGSTQSTAADSISELSLPQVPTEYLQPKRTIFRLFGSKIRNSVCIPIGIAVSVRFKRLKHWIKSHPQTSVGILMVFLLLILVLLLVTFLVIIPHNIQRELDQTVLDLAHAKITDPQDDHFTISVESNIKRTLGTPVTLKEFRATVRYAPSRAFREEYLNLMHKSRLSSQGVGSPKLSGMYHHNSRQLSNSDFPHHEISQSSLSSETNVRRRRLQEDGIDGGDPFNFIEPRVYYDLGRMTVPDQTISGRSSVSSYTSRYDIVDLQLFSIFLRELITLGHSDWTIVGHPPVRVMGLTFQGSLFEKPMPVHGPKLFTTEAEFLALLETATDARHDKNLTKPLQSIDSPTDKSSSTVLRSVTIPLVDLTGSTDEVARVSLRVRMDNKAGLATVDPIGAMTVLVKYRGQPIMEVTSKESTVLKPGLNVIDFTGEFTPLDLGGEERQAAMTHLFSSMYRGESPVLETTGIACSIPLFSPAIETVHMYTFLNLLENGKVADNPNSYNITSDSIDEESVMSDMNDRLNKRRGLPVIQEMKIEQLELVQNPTVQEEVGIKGRVLAVIGSPLGPNSSIEVPMVRLVGDILTPAAEHDTTKRAIMANFYGTLQGLGKGRIVHSRNGGPVISHMGAMPVSTQTIVFDMNLILNLTDKGAEFQKFVKAYIREKHLELSLYNVNATVTTSSALGPLELIDVPMDKDIPMIGFNKLQGVKLVNFAIESIPLLTSDTDGFTIVVSVMIPSEAAVDIYLGTLFVDLRYQGSHLVYMSAPKCRIAPGENFFNFTGQAKPSEIGLGRMFQFVRNYLSGQPSKMEVEMISAIPNFNATKTNDDVKVPDWIQQALTGLVLEVDVGAKSTGGQSNGGGTGIGSLLFGGDPSGSQTEMSGMSSDSQNGQQPRGGLLSNLLSGIVNGIQNVAQAASSGS